MKTAGAAAASTLSHSAAVVGAWLAVAWAWLLTAWAQLMEVLRRVYAWASRPFVTHGGSGAGTGAAGT